MKKHVFAWLVWRLPAALFWMVALLLFARMAAPSLNISGGVLLLALPALVIALSKGKQRANYLFYVLAFPVFITFIVARDLLDPKRWSAEVLRLAFGPIAAVIYVLLLFFIDLSMVASRDIDHVKPSVWFAILSNYMLVAVAMRFAIAPTFLLTAPWMLLYRLRTQIEKDDRFKKRNSADQKEAKELQAAIRTTMNAIIQRVSNGIVFIFLAFFGFVFSVTVLNFACIYFSVRRLDSNAFDGLQTGFVPALFFSVSTIATAPLAVVTPSTLFEQCVYCSELTFTVALVTICISTFSIGVGLNQSQIVGFQCELQRARDWLVEIVGYDGSNGRMIDAETTSELDGSSESE